MPEHFLLPPMERAPTYLEERDRENEVALRFSAILALAVDFVTFIVHLAVFHDTPGRRLLNVLAAAAVAAAALTSFVATSRNLRIGRSGSARSHGVFWTIVVAGGVAGYAGMLDNIEGFISFVGALFGAAVLFRAHWTFFGWLYAAAASFISALALLSVPLATALPIVAYCFIFALVSFALAVKLERDHLRFHQVRRELSEKNALLEELSFKDPLTMLFNRRYLVESLQHEITVARRYNVPLAVGMVDVDLFKRVNDELGHPIGDSVLKELALTMSGSLRDSDVLARYGGEEFLIIFVGSNLHEARGAAERVRLAAFNRSFRGVPWRLTISIGVTALRPEDGEEQLLKRADELLYRAKHQGRNCVVTE